MKEEGSACTNKGRFHQSPRNTSPYSLGHGSEKKGLPGIIFLDSEIIRMTIDAQLRGTHTYGELPDEILMKDFSLCQQHINYLTVSDVRFERTANRYLKVSNTIK